MTELVIDGVATGGDGVGREASGRVVFVPGALPGERVSIDVVEEKVSFARGRLLEVHRANEGRAVEPCVHLAEGCGGCDLQHASPGLAATLKTTMVADSLERIGRIDDVEVTFGGAVPALAYRTTVRAAVVGDRAGFRARRSHDVVVTPDCLVAHPTIRRVLAEGRFPGATAVTVRVGARTGDCVTVVDGPTASVSVPVGSVVASDAPVGTRGVREVAAGRTWQVSPGSFFQSCPEAAELIVQTVAEAVGSEPIGRLVDLYAGVGLFAGTIGEASSVTAVESNRGAVADARENLAGVDATVVRCRVERWRATPADIVVADPSRAGLGRAGVGTVVATRAPRVVLVACDAASFARDAGLLAESGLVLQRAVVLDLFPQTSHVEVVGLFSQA